MERSNLSAGSESFDVGPLTWMTHLTDKLCAGQIAAEKKMYQITYFYLIFEFMKIVYLNLYLVDHVYFLILAFPKKKN